jgi:hypothetical protein
MGDIANAVTKAQKSLERAFGESLPSEGEGAGRFLNIKELAKAYSKEANANTVSKEFTRMANSIRKMRSSYLPIDFYLEPGADPGSILSFFDATIVSETASMESYENAFMRMLGMPLVDTGTASDSEITSSQNIKIMNLKTGDPEEVPYETVRTDIMDMRQRVRGERRIRVDDAIFNLQAPGVLSEEEEEIDAGIENAAAIVTAFADQITGELTNEPEEDRSDDPKVVAIETDLFKFSYLLIPPIQDGRISGCINEPAKIVAPPFSNSRARNINSTKIRPTLLESVIRIRLDKISGTDSFFTPTTDDSLTGQAGDAISGFASDATGGLVGGDDDPGDTTDDYGFLESLFILRLRSALSGLAKKTIKDVDQLIMEILKTKREPTPIDESTGADAPNVPAGASIQTKKNDDDDDLITKDAKTREQMKLIEDSIMILLGDNSEVLDLQAQTQRNSSIQDAHLMSGIIDVIDVPRRRIIEEITDIGEARSAGGEKKVEPLVSNLKTVLGTDIGIGTVDIVVFSLALFSLKEKSLLGLLSKDAFNRLKNDKITAALLPEEGDQEDQLFAINDLTDLLIDGYKTFVDELRNDKC